LFGSTKILIVEDDFNIANIYEHILKDEKYDVEIAWDAPEALAKILAFKPDVVLLDIMIPGIDGLELLHLVRTDPQYADIQPKVLITTNLAQEDKAQIAKKYGADGYIVKANIDPHDLGPILTQLMASKTTATDSSS
jgi:CheY-like chemotaxis protein